MNDFFAALNDPTRRQILSLLAQQELPAGEIANHFSVSRPAVSHHLSVLRAAGLVDCTRRGQLLVYRINMTLIQEAIAWLYTLKEGTAHENGGSIPQNSENLVEN